MSSITHVCWHVSPGHPSCRFWVFSPAGGSVCRLRLGVEPSVSGSEGRFWKNLPGVILRRHSALCLFQVPVMSMSSCTICPCRLKLVTLLETLSLVKSGSDEPPLQNINSLSTFILEVFNVYNYVWNFIMMLPNYQPIFTDVTNQVQRSITIFSLRA